jgi:Xaa-Pro aminopeptidase
MTESPAAQSFAKAEVTSPRFDSARLDALLDEAGMDAVVISSKHNIQYLFGGYRFFFFDHFDAIGVSRYLPILIYVKGRPDQSTYIGHGMEAYEKELGKFWTPAFQTSSTSFDSARLAADHLAKLAPKLKRVGVERAFLPADAAELMARELPGVTFLEAHMPLERLRARKTREELDLLRLASELVVDSMLAVIASHGPGATKAELVEALRREEVNRGLTFEYCLITAGTSLNRAPSDQVWGPGDILSLDSGGNYKGYIGDLCRMAIQGEPDSELEALLGEVDEIQMAARTPIRPGAKGGEIYASAGEVLKRSSRANSIEFVAHGMGLISHEAPRLTSHGPIPYPAHDADLPLESGMVISIETTIADPRRGFIKLEDTVAVTDQGWEAFGDRGRGWNRADARAS